MVLPLFLLLSYHNRQPLRVCWSVDSVYSVNPVNTAAFALKPDNSCSRVFGVFPENTLLQMEIIDFGQKLRAP
jgi:hypothetical protein